MPKVVWLGVTSANTAAVEVYRACEWTTLAGFSSTATMGISARELRAAMLNLGVRKAKYRDTTQRVDVMVRVARPLLNRKRKK